MAKPEAPTGWRAGPGLVRSVRRPRRWGQLSLSHSPSSTLRKGWSVCPQLSLTSLPRRPVSAHKPALPPSRAHRPCPKSQCSHLTTSPLCPHPLGWNVAEMPMSASWAVRDPSSRAELVWIPSTQLRSLSEDADVTWLVRPAQPSWQLGPEIPALGKRWPPWAPRSPAASRDPEISSNFSQAHGHLPPPFLTLQTLGGEGRKA